MIRGQSRRLRGIHMKKNLTFGEWKIEVDIDLTQKYYRSFSVVDKDSQCYRNYYEFCKNMTEAEKSFFQAFAIDPLLCNVMTVGMTKEKHFPSSGHYCFAGRYSGRPEEIEMTVEELVEKNYIDDSPDSRVYIDRFQLTFMDADSLFATIPEGIPEGFLCVGFFIEEMPWLLNEKPEQKLYYQPKPWQFVRKVKERINHNKRSRKLEEVIKNEVAKLLDRNNIEYAEISKSAVKKYMEDWFEAIVPKAQQKEARKHCFSNRKYSCYLWHTFSYLYVPCIEGEDAKIKFDNTVREKAVLLLNSQKIGYILDNPKDITASDLDEFNDVIFTEEGFSWTYVHTHEQQCGPYFYFVEGG